MRVTGAGGRLGRGVRLAFAALLVYVRLDLANPLMPGAVCFDPDDSVEAVGRTRTSAALPSITVSPTAEAVPTAGPVAHGVAMGTTPRREPPVPIVPRARTAPTRGSSRSFDDH